MDSSVAKAPGGSVSRSRGSKGGPNDGGKVYRRTKSGCLTCRNRRIKCDEAKPLCNNCLKSKRYCLGYQTNYQFKPPLGQSAYGENPQVQRSPVRSPPFSLHEQPRASPEGALALLAPRPPHDIEISRMTPHQTSSFLGSYQLPTQHTSYQFGPSDCPPLQNPLADVSYTEHGSGLVHMQPQFYVTESGISHVSVPWPNNQIEPAVDLDTARQMEYYNHGTSRVDRLHISSNELSTEESSRTFGNLDAAVQEASSSIPRRYTVTLDASCMAEQSNALAPGPDFIEAAILQSPEMRSIFLNFITCTGPTLSLYERPPFDYIRNHGTKCLWNHTLPAEALKSPVLLHAMLALSGLQMAKLDDGPLTTCLKQYHLSIRRLAKEMSSPAATKCTAMLAASLLLGYFEVWLSKHSSWCNHLLGSSIILRGMPIDRMTRRCLPAKRFKFRTRALSQSLGATVTDAIDPDEYDYKLLSMLTGYTVSADHYGLGNNITVNHPLLTTTDKDIEKYETIRDLLWWYNKLDVYQSILGGSKLLREYRLWINCPPRSRLGYDQAINGTYDHVILLLARLSNFAAKDLPRKRKVFKTGSSSTASSPQFPGIVPTSANVTAPRGFGGPGNQFPQTVSNEEIDTGISLREALHEWNSIHQAFGVLKQELEKAFSELPQEFTGRRSSPFGPPLQYRSFAIAGIWMNYYMGMIRLWRCHPDMSPAGMPAAKEAENLTSGYAIRVGQIAAGLGDETATRGDRIDVGLGGAFIESAFCLFVAGVQYKDDNQRHWVIRRMCDIVRLIGWQSGIQIAKALEGGWTKMHQLGDGPAYTRAPGLVNLEPQTWDNPRRVDRRIYRRNHTQDQPLANADKANLAFGLIAIEEDLKALNVDS